MEEDIVENTGIEHIEEVKCNFERANKNKRSYKQIYRKDWESNPIFKGWLSPVSCDKYKAVCTACNKELLAHRLTLLKHASSAKHLKKVSLGCDSIATGKVFVKKEPEECNLTDRSENDEKSFQINGTTQGTDENIVDILPQLVNLDGVANTEEHASLNNMDKVFAEEMEAQLSQLTAEEVETNTASLENGISSVQQRSSTNAPNGVSDNIASIIIQADSFVNIADSSEAINFKQGYIAKNQDDKEANAIICAAAFLSDKMDESGTTSVINKITTYPLQISTRVTDYSRGISVSNLAITLYKLTGGKWICVGESVTDEVGRCNLIPKNDTFFSVGCYKLHYDVTAYYELQSLKSYFPFIEISFLMRSPHETHHIPLMISPNGYTAYRSLDY